MFKGFCANRCNRHWGEQDDAVGALLRARVQQRGRVVHRDHLPLWRVVAAHKPSLVHGGREGASIYGSRRVRVGDGLDLNEPRVERVRLRRVEPRNQANSWARHVKFARRDGGLLYRHKSPRIA